MTNAFYNRLNDFLPGTRIRSAPVDAELNAVAAGFALVTKELKRKTANQDVTGDTLTDDTHLTGFSLAASGIYRVLGVFTIDEVTPTADIEYQLVLGLGLADNSALSFLAQEDGASAGIVRGGFETNARLS